MDNSADNVLIQLSVTARPAAPTTVASQLRMELLAQRDAPVPTRVADVVVEPVEDAEVVMTATPAP